MKFRLCLARTAFVMAVAAVAMTARADVLEMNNGDRYSGKVLAVSAETVVLDSEILGKINVPRSRVASLAFGTNAVARTISAAPIILSNAPASTPLAPLARTNVDLSAALRQLGANTNFVGQIRNQMLAGSPEAGAKYDELVSGLLDGTVSLDDLRKQAQASAEQLRELKRELGPAADESLDAYLKVLDGFIQETAHSPSPPSP
jgi:hypothetical protein